MTDEDLMWMVHERELLHYLRKHLNDLERYQGQFEFFSDKDIITKVEKQRFAVLIGKLKANIYDLQSIIELSNLTIELFNRYLKRYDGDEK